MDPRNAFLSALAENEDDTMTRLVYADWLEEQGEHEEADRQRQWPAAKKWLIQFCEQHNRWPDHGIYPDDSGDDDVWRISYQDIIRLGHQALEKPDREYIGFSCGNNESMCNALRVNSASFWKQWSIITGIPLPADIETKSSFSC